MALLSLARVCSQANFPVLVGKCMLGVTQEDVASFRSSLQPLRYRTLTISMVRQ